MTIREKFADWISGGALSDARQSLNLNRIWREDSDKRLDRAEAALKAIIATDTPKGAHALKRAVKIAEEGLGAEVQWYTGYDSLTINPRDLR